VATCNIILRCHRCAMVTRCKKVFWRAVNEGKKFFFHFT